jgi:hypothetical protein
VQLPHRAKAQLTHTAGCSQAANVPLTTSAKQATSSSTSSSRSSRDSAKEPATGWHGSTSLLWYNHEIVTRSAALNDGTVKSGVSGHPKAIATRGRQQQGSTQTGMRGPQPHTHAPAAQHRPHSPRRGRSCRRRPLWRPPCTRSGRCQQLAVRTACALPHTCHSNCCQGGNPDPTEAHGLPL